MTLVKGWGYWDISCYPYGGDFKRATEDRTVTVLGPGVKANESKVEFSDGKRAIVDKRALREVSA